MKIFTGVQKMAFAIGLFGLMASLSSLAQSGGDAEKELLKIQHEWAAARVDRNVPYLERLYAKEFRVQNMSGSVVERETDIAAFASGDLKPDYVKNTDMTVSIYGDAAIVTGIENVGGTYKGNYGEFSFRFANVFVRRDDRWQLVLHQSTPIKEVGLPPMSRPNNSFKPSPHQGGAWVRALGYFHPAAALLRAGLIQALGRYGRRRHR